MNLNPQELAKVRKAALNSVTLTSEMKITVLDAKLKELNTEIKKILGNQETFLEVFYIRTIAKKKG